MSLHAALLEALERIDGQAVCVGMDGPEGDGKMLAYIHEIAAPILARTVVKEDIAA